jgi:ABC-type transport system involved in cytochrome c biogenesis ATPase subunit
MFSRIIEFQKASSSLITIHMMLHTKKKPRISAGQQVLLAIAQFWIEHAN